MKSLRDYLVESRINEAESEKKFVWDFTGLTNAEEAIKSFENMDNVEIDGQKVIVTVTAENYNTLSSFQEIMQDYVNTFRKEQSNFSNEQYAQKTKRLEDTLLDFNEYLDEVENPEDSEEPEKPEDNKEETE